MLMFLVPLLLGSRLSEELWVLHVAMQTTSPYNTCSLMLDCSETAEAILFIVIKINSFYLEVTLGLGVHV